MNFFLLTLAQGIEFIAVILQLPSVLLFDLSRVLLSVYNGMNNNGADENGDE